MSFWHKDSAIAAVEEQTTGGSPPSETSTWKVDQSALICPIIRGYGKSTDKGKVCRSRLKGIPGST